MPRNQGSLQAWFTLALPLHTIEIIDDVVATNQQIGSGPTNRYGVVRLAVEHFAKAQRKRRHTAIETQDTRD